MKLISPLLVSAEITLQPKRLPGTRRRLSHRSKTATAYIVRAKPGLITLVDLRFLAFGAGGNARVDFSEPLRDRLFVSLIGAFDRTLHAQAPALQITAHRRKRQAHRVLALDQQLHRGSRPQVKGQLQLFRHLAHDQPANALRLSDAQFARLASSPTTPLGRQCLHPVGAMHLSPLHYRPTAYPKDACRFS